MSNILSTYFILLLKNWHHFLILKIQLKNHLKCIYNVLENVKNFVSFHDSIFLYCEIKYKNIIKRTFQLKYS